MSKKNVATVEVEVKTQKAKGILALKQYNGFDDFSTGALQSVRVFPYNAVPEYPFFARPCPMRPRHGFVDSRLVKNQEEWKQVRTEVAASDEPDAEIICMPFLSADWSAIVTPAGMTVGPGNDGATAGNGALTIPAAAPNTQEFVDAFHLTSAMEASDVKECPYIELVYSGGTIEAVQLRDGPMVTLGTECVKKDTVVKELVEAGGDLLEWETKMKVLAGKEGVVIWHPGGCLSSHYAVQAIVHDLPVMCTADAPEIGSTLKATQGGPAKLKAEDYQTMARLIVWLLNNATPSQHQREGIRLAIAGMHAQAQWGPERHLLVLRAVAVTYMIRFAAATILGELRHWSSVGPGRNGKKRQTELSGPDADKKSSRSQVYEFAFMRNQLDLVEKLRTAVLDFATPGWGGSYGGKKWMVCAKATGNLCAALGEFLKKPTEASWTKVIGKWNICVNVAHNTGVMLDKFLNKHYMDQFARVPLAGLTTNLVGNLCMRAHLIGEDKRTAAMAKQLLEVKKNVPKAESVKVEAKTKMPWDGRFQVGGGVVHLQIALDPAFNRDYGASFSFPAPDELMKTMAGAKKTAQSLTGSGNAYVPCKVSFLKTEKAIVVGYDLNGVPTLTKFLASHGSHIAQVINQLAVWPEGIDAAILGEEDDE